MADFTEKVTYVADVSGLVSQLRAAEKATAELSGAIKGHTETMGSAWKTLGPVHDAVMAGIARIGGPLGPLLSTVESTTRGISSHLGLLGGSANEAGSLFSKMGASGKGAGDLIGAALGGGAIAAGAGIAAMALKGVGDFASLTGEIRKFRIESGASAEDSSRMVVGFNELGVPLENVDKGLFKLSRSIADGGSALGQYGVTVAKTKDGHADLVGTFLNVSEAIHNTTDASTRNQIAFAAFGKQGEALLPILNKGKEGLSEFFKIADQRHEVFSDKDLQQGKEFDLALKSLEGAGESLFISLGRGLVPIITTVAEGFATVVDVVNDVTHSIGGLGGIVEGVAKTALGPLGGILDLLPARHAKASDAAKAHGKATTDLGGSMGDAGGEAGTMGEQLFLAGKKAEQAAAAHAAAVEKVTTVFGTQAAAGSAMALSIIGSLDSTDKAVAASGQHQLDAVAAVVKGFSNTGDAGDALAQRLLSLNITNSTALQSMAEAAGALHSNMASSFGAATNVVDAFKDKVDVNFTDINKFFADQITTTRNWSNNLVALSAAGVDGGLIDQLAQAGPKAAPLVAALLDDVKRGNLDTINQSQKDLHTILDNTFSSIEGRRVDAYASGEGVGASFGHGLAGMGSSTRDVARGLAGMAIAGTWDKSDEIGDAGKGLGHSVVGGLEKGVHEHKESFFHTLIGVANDAVSAVKSFLGISSPSRVFAEIGGHMMSGLAEGITTGSPAATAALGDVLANLSPNPAAFASSLGSTFERRPTTLGEALALGATDPILPGGSPIGISPSHQQNVTYSYDQRSYVNDNSMSASLSSGDQGDMLAHLRAEWFRARATAT